MHCKKLGKKRITRRFGNQVSFGPRQWQAVNVSLNSLPTELLTVPKPKEPAVAQKKAIENAWTTQYRGEAPAALWTRIKKVMKQGNQYARYLAIVQSSGTGKSRMIEELSKKHLVIPVNLLDSYHETGYPPTDKKAYTYLTRATSQEEARVHAVAFLRAVFKEASKLITEFRESLPEGMGGHDQIVDLFSKYMSKGMTWDSHGDQRQSFYDNVGSGASTLEREIQHAFATNNKMDLDDQLESVGIREAFTELIETLFPSPHKDSRQRRMDPEHLVILAFDEARTLTNSCINEPWSHFSELRRALRALNEQPLCSLFLATTGNVNVNAVVPSSRKNLSLRMQSEKFSVSRPFAEVGFDHFAFKDCFDLREVTDIKHISHFGRPLWATRYEEGNATIKSEIVQFAAVKLCARKNYRLGDALNHIEKLACLAQRLPIEFHSVTYASKLKELELVERHMRILLRLDAGFESLTTVSASEPLLSEAAYLMMNPDTKFKAAEMLTSCLDGYVIHKGDRGELLVMLLFTLARDRAVGQPDGYGLPDSGQRWCSVLKFMNALFEFERHPPGGASLKASFAKSKIFFNHWVKVHQYTVVDVQYLAQLMRRGAALLCATNQAGIDGIIPYLLTGYTIFPKNVGVILWQGNNDAKFTDEPKRSLFKAMNPYKLGILNKEDNIPIIRIVFALASEKPCLARVVCEDGVDSLDFWVAGISPTVFSPVGDDDASIWTALLQATYGWEDIYKKNPDGSLTDPAEEGLRRSMNPGTAKDGSHWENWADFAPMRKIKVNAEDENENMDKD
ncbi:hypothetical protein M378DRAFT_628828 [Amanita muscaria Koide BX008]|uniref:Uncharacterized protein n=1 Tax=Amanita muscaria (strain Koide BX008) TaxID=946122 RepID=A0A0C2X662_AMAMK|nr:hypothetical protein M378DRAFT_628828 [Amanita muscaria Koide BX008]